MDGKNFIPGFSPTSVDRPPVEIKDGMKSLPMKSLPRTLSPPMSQLKNNRYMPLPGFQVNKQEFSSSHNRVQKPSGLPSFRVSVSVVRSALFGGGAEDAKAIGRRIRWVSRRDAAFSGVRRLVTSHFWEMCRRGGTIPTWGTSQIDAAEAIVVTEDMVPVIDPVTGQIVPAKPLMPPNTSMQLTGFTALRVDPKTPNLLYVDLIGTTPGKSQGKALISFVIQKARELGFHAIRLGSTDQTIPIRRRPRPRPGAQRLNAAYLLPRASANQMSDSEGEEGEEGEEGQVSDTETQEEETDSDEDTDDAGPVTELSAVSAVQGGSGTKIANLSSPRPPIARPLGAVALPRRRLRRVVQRVGGVDDLYRGFMRYLERQSMFQPKCGGHLLQFTTQQV